jgi:hypothetical protein
MARANPDGSVRTEEVGMAAREYVLAVALYADPEDAQADLRLLTGSPGLRRSVAGAGLYHRGLTRHILMQRGGGTVAYAAVTGAAAGIAVGAFLGLPLIGAAVGGVAGALLGRRMGREEFTALSVLLDDAVPVGGTGLIAVVPEEDLARVREALPRALRTTGRVLDERPLTRVALTLVRGNPVVTEALKSQQGESG